MAVVTGDRVKETSTTEGTGAFTLLGAVTGFRTFASEFGAGTTAGISYCIHLQGGSEWEVGKGSLNGTTMVLTRTVVEASSNAGAAVNFSAGTKNVFATFSAADAALISGAAGVAYTNPLGSGFRQLEITASTTGGLGNGDVQSVLSGTPNNIFFFTTSAGACSIKFVFPVAVIMTAVAFIQDVATANGTWQAAGSNNGTDWTDLGSTFAWGGATVSEGTWANTTAYLQYRFTKTAGSTSSTPYQQQINFKLA